MNSFLIGEVVGKYKNIQNFISFILFIPLFINKMFGNEIHHFHVEVFMVLGALAIMITIKLLLNLEQNMILQVI